MKNEIWPSIRACRSRQRVAATPQLSENLFEQVLEFFLLCGGEACQALIECVR